MKDSTIPAPPRRVALIRACILAGVLGASVALMHFLLFPAMRQYLAAATDRADAIARLGVVMAWLSVFCVGLSTYFLLLGIRVLRHEQWPLAGSWVFRETTIQRGAVARIRGGLLLFGGLVALACAILALAVPANLAAA